jgi:hypothetical protein
MRLREKLWRGSPVWPPPAWTGSCGAGDNFSTGESGILRRVHLYKSPPPFPPQEAYLTITAEFQGQLRSGLIFESPEHLESLYFMLKKYVGRPLRDLGDLEID